MLRKLMKHEFRATGRLMLPVYLAVLVLAIFANLSIRILENSEIFVLSTLAGLTLFAFVLSLLIVSVMSLVLMIQRFYRNLLTDEGYLMCTLPVSMHKLIWSKLLVSTTWYAATTLISLLSLLIVAFRAGIVIDAFKGLNRVLRYLFDGFGINTLLLTAEILAVALLGVFFLCLMCYAAMAMGQSFSNRKLLLSVVFYFVFSIALEILGTVVTGLLIPFSYSGLYNNIVAILGPQGILYAALGTIIVTEAALCGIFYGLTHWRLTRHLNLQ